MFDMQLTFIMTSQRRPIVRSIHPQRNDTWSVVISLVIALGMVMGCGRPMAMEHDAREHGGGHVLACVQDTVEIAGVKVSSDALRRASNGQDAGSRVSACTRSGLKEVVFVLSHQNRQRTYPRAIREVTICPTSFLS